MHLLPPSARPDAVPAGAAVAAGATVSGRVGKRRPVLAGEIDLPGFRRAARQLLAAGVPPGEVEWQVAGAAAGDDLFAAEPAGGIDGVAVDRAAADVDAGADDAATDAHVDADAVVTDAHAAVDDAAAGAQAAAGHRKGVPAVGDRPTAQPGIAVPAAFVELCAEVVQHRDPGRFGLLYRLLWRLVHEPALRHDPLDPDRLRAAHLAQVVRREQHKMKAFVRFRPVGAPQDRAVGEGADRLQASQAIDAIDAIDAAGDLHHAKRSARPAILHVAWFEPAHHVVEAVAPFFARRFATLRWMLLTPERSVRWDGAQLDFGPGARRDEAPPADAGERLWLTYYEHIFNPARLKLAAMRREMPRRYWPNLPEAVLIAPLAAAAAERSARMVAQEPAGPRRRIPSISRIAGDVGAGADAGVGVGVEMRETGVGTRPAAAAEGGVPATAEFFADAPNAVDRQASPAEREALLAFRRAAAARCGACPLHRDATQVVWGEGPAGAPLMLVGEQPGDQEDLRGRPFVGPAGQLLDRALAALGWPRERLYLTNAVKHFGFELRGRRRIHKTPAQRDAAACLHWLEEEIALVRPGAVVALGATAARQLLGRPLGVLRERGRWLERADGLRVLVTLHPSALLRMPAEAFDEAYAHWLDDLRLASPSFGTDSG